MSVLCLHVPLHWDASHPDLPWHWSNDQGGRGVVESGSALPSAREVRLMVPSDLALHTVLEVPRRGRWQDALAYALEERLLDDPDRLHVAAGAPLADGRTPVVAIDRQWLSDAVARAGALGATPQGAFSDAAVEPVASDEWLVLVGTDGALLVDATGMPSALDLVGGMEPPRMLVARLEEGNASERLRCIRLRGRPGLDCEVLAAAWSARLPVGVATGPAWTGQTGTLPANTINLLQGPLAPRHGLRWPGGLAAWRPALILLLASLLIWLLAMLAQTWHWRREQAELSARSEAALRRAFPDTRAILDPVLQMKRGLEDLRARAGVGAAAGPASLLERLGGADEGLPAHLRHLSFRQGALDADWECADAACSDALRARLGQPQRAIAASAIRVDGQHVHAHLDEVPP